MAGTYLSPGVYVEELPGGARAIEGVATSNTLFMGYTRRGPTDGSVRISSWSDYVDTFGGWGDGQPQGINDYREGGPGDQTVDLMGHSVFAYFQNGGRIAYIRRVVDEADGEGDSGASAASLSTMQPVPMTFEAANPGTWGDGLEVVVEANPFDDDASDPTRWDITVSRTDAAGRTTTLEQFADIEATTDDELRTVVGGVLEQSSDLVRLREDAPTANDPARPGVHRSGDVIAAGFDLDLTGATEAMRTMAVRLAPDTDDTTDFRVDAREYESFEELAGELEAGLRASTTDGDLDAAIRDGLTVTVIRDEEADEAFIEVTSGLATADEDEEGEEDVPENPKCIVRDTGLGGQLGFDESEAVRGFDRASTGPMSGGDDGSIGQQSDYQAVLDELRLNDDVNVIVTPNHVADGTDPVPGLVRAHCEAMGDRVQIVDIPEKDELAEPDDVTGVTGGTGTSTYSQTYYPWVEVSNPIHHPDLRPDAPRTVFVPPSGFAAGMWGRIDTRRGVWKAPAGVETSLTGVVGFKYTVGDAQQQLLNPAGVNVLRTKRGYGPVIWGTRTLATRANPEWRYIPVRRTAIMIEKALRNGIQWAVFEPNDHNLWASLRLSAESYMDGLYRAGAFQGTKATDAYSVQCGLDSTMKQGDIDRGYVILRVGFAPLKPAEFVVIQIKQLVGQS